MIHLKCFKAITISSVWFIWRLEVYKVSIPKPSNCPRVRKYLRICIVSFVGSLASRSKSLQIIDWELCLENLFMAKRFIQQITLPTKTRAEKKLATCDYRIYAQYLRTLYVSKGKSPEFIPLALNLSIFPPKMESLFLGFHSSKKVVLGTALKTLAA